MIGYDSRQVERKVISILRILSESPQPLGARAAPSVRSIGTNGGRRRVSPWASKVWTCMAVQGTRQ